MRGLKISLANIRVMAIALTLCLVVDANAQPPQPAENAAALVETEKSKDENDDAKQGSHFSFILTRSQSVIQCMELLREAFQRKDYLTAVPLMDRVLSEPNSFVPADTTSEVAAHEEVRRLAAQLPADFRKRLDDQRQVTASLTWDQAKKGGTEEIISFSQKYSDLLQGVEALWSLGLRERDLGRLRFAVEAFSRMAAHPKATRQQRAVALIAEFELLFDAKRIDDATAVRDRLNELDPNLKLVIGGQTIGLGQWLAEHRFDSASPTRQESSTSSDIVNSRLRRPISLPIWKQEFTNPLISPAIGASLVAQESRQRDLGVSPIPLVRPMIVGERVFVRNLDRIHAYHLMTGVNQWFQSNTEYKEIEKLGLFERVMNQSAVTDWVQRRTQADSIFGRMSADGRRLFAIQEPDRAREFSNDRQSRKGESRGGPRFNKLAAYSLSDGTLEWEVGGNLADAAEAYRGCFFLGCPFVLDELLYAVVQRETEVQLLTIESKSGALLWSMTLGDVLLPVSEDLQRSRVACPIIWDQGQLLVSTGAGAIVAIDPILRSLKWSYRYSARTISADDLLQGQNPGEHHKVQESWWDNWREPFLDSTASLSTAGEASRQSSGMESLSSGILIFASPETDMIHAIRLPNGEPLWHVPKNGGLLLTGIVSDRVIVIEGDFARAHDLETGQQLWRTATTELSGPGVLTGSILVLPIMTGGTMLLDVMTGQLISDSSVSETPLGGLAEGEKGWIASNRQGIMRLPRLGEIRDEVERELQSQPDSESLRIRAAFLDLQSGNFDSARGRLEGLKSTPARELRREALIDALRDFGVHRTRAERSDLAKQLNDLAEDPDFKFAAAAAIGSSAISVGDFVAAVDALLDGLSIDLNQPETLVKMGSILVRKDRVLLGLIEEAYRRAKPGDLPLLDELFADRLKEARKSKDRFAIQQLAQQWRGLDWGRRLVVADEEKALRKQSLTEVEVRFLDAAGSDDRAIAVQALERLAGRLERNKFVSDAWAVRQRIQKEFPATIHDGAPKSDALQNEAPSSTNLISNTRKPIWPDEPPKVDSVEVRSFSVFTQIPLHAEPGSLADRLDIWVDRNGSKVLFRGESFFQSGQDEDQERRLMLPQAMSNYRGANGYMLREAWGIGRIVVMLVGTELFAITPFDNQGEPNAKSWWSIELGPAPVNSKIIKGRTGANDGYEILVDQSNRQIGKVGPVRAGYLCYQKGTRLVAVETETGRALWERLDQTGEATILGDDHCVYLWSEGNVLEVLSAVDGRKIEDRVWKTSPTNLIHSRGSLVWTLTRGDEAKLELTDLRTGNSIWNRAEPKDSKVVVLDPETLAIVHLNHQMNLVEARTGLSLCPPIELKFDSLERIVAWYDSERWYIAVSSSVNDLSTLKSAQWHDSYRRVFVRGTLFALDRMDQKILWQRDLKDEPISLEQSRASPLLVQVWRLATPSKNGMGEVVLQAFDKRTGKLIVKRQRPDLEPYFLLNPDPQQGIVELRLARETIRINYTPRSME